MLNPDTVVRIKRIAQKLNYTPNRVARALSTGRQGNIAILVPDIANPFFPPLIRAAQRAADAAGYGVFIGDSDEDPNRETALAHRLSPQIEGLVLVSPRMEERQIRGLARLRPVILVNRDITSLPRVLIDPAIGLGRAMGHLHALGHRHVIYVSGPATSWSDQRRRVILSDAAAHHDMRIEIVSDTKPTFQGARTATARILATGATAAIAFDDFVAHGLLAGLAERRIEVPQRFSLIGFDDVLGASTFPALTSVAAPCEDAGLIALELLLQEIRSEARRPRLEVLPTRLIIRDTTGSIRK